MMVHCRLPVLRKSFTVWLGILVSLGMIAGCGGGSGGGTGSPSANLPTVSIASPTGTYFKEGENIVFGGSATDSGGGQLTGSALVWSSNVDGQIGTGETLTTSALSAGDHNITLTATDSSSATSIATATITVAQTRFIKMGAETTGVSDASNAFDGDMDTAATIMTPDTEYIYFNAHIGTDNNFFFKIKIGAVSTSGSKILIEGLAGDGSWQFVSDEFLYTEKTITIQISNAQDFTDTEGYIKLRASWVNGQSTDSVPVYEFWRIDPPYIGSETQEVTNAESAFDESQSSFATIAEPWNPLNPQGNQNFLHFKAYVGLGVTDTFAFNILMNNLGASQSFALYVEDFSTTASGDWKLVETLPLDSDSIRTVTIQDAQNYLDANGYISLRGSWTTVDTGMPASSLKIYEIWRADHFVIGPKTTTDPQFDYFIENAVDGDDNSAASLYYFWSEYNHYEFFHFQAYAGDASHFNFSIRSGISTIGSNSELIVEGESEPDKWSPIERIPLDDISTTMINLSDARQYVDADGLLSIRVRWESDSDQLDAFIYEIRHETD
jgi:hypothetical protein